MVGVITFRSQMTRTSSRPLILAIQPDRRQASQLAAVGRRISAELLLMSSTDQAIAALGKRLPDLILTPALLSHKDITALTDRLRDLGDAAAHIQMLTIPVLETAATPPRGGVLSTLRTNKRKRKARTAEPIGCQADTFAEQIAIYLDQAVTARRPQSALDVKVAAAAPSVEPEPDVATHGAHTEGSHCASPGEIERSPTIEELSSKTPCVPEPDGSIETSMEAVASILPLACTAAADRPVAIPTVIPHVTHLPMGLPSVDTSASWDDVMPPVPETVGPVETDLDVAGIVPLVTAATAERSVPVPDVMPAVTPLLLRLPSVDTSASLDDVMPPVPETAGPIETDLEMAGIVPFVTAATPERPAPVPDVIPAVTSLLMRLPSADTSASIDQAVPVIPTPAASVDMSLGIAAIVPLAGAAADDRLVPKPPVRTPDVALPMRLPSAEPAVSAGEPAPAKPTTSNSIEASREVVALIASLVGAARTSHPVPKAPAMMRDLAAPLVAFPSRETPTAADEHSSVLPKPMDPVESRPDALTAGAPRACASADESSVPTRRAVSRHARKVARKKMTLQAHKAARKGNVPSSGGNSRASFRSS